MATNYKGKLPSMDSVLSHVPTTSLIVVGYILQIFHSIITPKYLCVVCKLVLRQPIQSFCGHRYCESCLRDLKSANTDGVTCQACIDEDSVNEYSDLSQTFLDKAMNRELNGLGVNCTADGCEWTGVLKEYDQHKTNCKHSLVTCICGMAISEDLLDSHEEHDCGHTLVACGFDCPTKVLRKDLDNHNEDFVHVHLAKLHVMCLEIESTTGNTTSEEELMRLSAKVRGMDTLVRSFMQTLSSASQQNGHGASNTQGINGQRLDDLNTEVANTMATIDQLYTNLETRLNNLGQIQRSAEDQQARLDAMRQTVTSLERNLALRDVSLADLDVRIQSAEYSTHDGSLVWRLSEWKRKFDDARAGRTPSLYSPPFFTSRSGYKMCLRLYPFGDGTGRGSHASLFFVVMRGPFDAVLSWPFRQKVTLTLIDQTSGRHLTESFRPDPSSSSFRRPNSDMNIASGCPLFAVHSALNEGGKYVRDDTCFVKVVVDSNGL